MSSNNILGRLRGGKGHETIVGFAVVVSNSSTKSNTWTCLLPTTIIEPSSKSDGLISLLLPNL